MPFKLNRGYVDGNIRPRHDLSDYRKQILASPQRGEMIKLCDNLYDLNIEYLKGKIEDIIKYKLNINSEKARQIVSRLPADTQYSLYNLHHMMLDICSREKGLEELKEALHYDWYDRKGTKDERLRMRAVVLFSLSWADARGFDAANTNFFKCARKIMDNAAAILEYKHDENPSAQSYYIQQKTAFQDSTERVLVQIHEQQRQPTQLPEMINQLNMQEWVIKTANNMLR